MGLAIWISAVTLGAAVVIAGVCIGEGLELVAKAIKKAAQTAKGGEGG